MITAPRVSRSGWWEAKTSSPHKPNTYGKHHIQVPCLDPKSHLQLPHEPRGKKGFYHNIFHKELSTCHHQPHMPPRRPGRQKP
jgi:hypothetical protein